MKMRITVLAAVFVSAAIVGGCGSRRRAPVGFLSDYSKLQIESKTAMVYINKAALGKYDKFIISPVQARLYEDVDISDEDLSLLQQYIYRAVFNEIEKKYKVVQQPGEGVARIRIALTNLKESNVALNVIPHTKLMGLGLGAASMEAEVLDSITGEQIGAAVRSQSGNQFSLDGYSKWSDAKSIIDKWASNLGKHLAEAK